MAKNPKIHELIAVESDRSAQANSITEEAVTTFTKKTDHFMGQTRRVEMYDAERQAENQTDIKEIVETVDRKLEHVWGSLIKSIDVTVTKDNSNTSSEARADVIIDGNVILESVPATALLTLEKQLGRIKALYQTVPTLDPAYAWVQDTSAALHGAMRTIHPQEQQKTEKQHDFKVLVPATDKHPAQVTEFTLDRNVGKIIVERQSGMVDPATKARWLERISTLITAVKQARQRANMADVIDLKVGKALRDFIHAA